MVFMTRFRRTDAPGLHVLVSVEELGGKGLNLKLIASEHSHLYHGRITASSAASSQSSHYDGTDEQWRNVLRKVFLDETADDNDLQDVEAVAAVNGSKLNITVRKNVGGITQRLGSLSLDEDDAREQVIIFDWVQDALALTEQYRAQLTQAETASTSQRNRITDLENQLNELIAAKKEHEDQLLQKFAALLNSKKLKIRDQQRILAGKTGSASHDSSRGFRPRQSEKVSGEATSRKAKRKASHDLEPAEKMEADEETEDEEGEGDVTAQDTPPQSDVESENSSMDADQGGEVVPATNGRSQKQGEQKAEQDLALREKANVTRSQTTTIQPLDAETDSETDDEL